MQKYDTSDKDLNRASEKILPSKIQTLGFLVARTASLCNRVTDMTSRFGVAIPESVRDSTLRPESLDYITQLELHLNEMDGLIQSMDNYMTELERIL